MSHPWESIPIPTRFESGLKSEITHKGTLEQTNSARDVLLNNSLCLYQLLFNKRLTCPPTDRCSGHPWSIEYDRHLFLNCTRICNGKQITIGGVDPHEIYQKILFLEQYLKEHSDANYVSSRACCPMARKEFCVCIERLECPIHGGQCYGSHD